MAAAGGKTIAPSALEPIKPESATAEPEKPTSDVQPKPAASTPAAPAKAPESVKAPEVPAKKKEGVEALREAYERQNSKVEELTGSLTATTKEKADALTRLAALEEKLNKAEERIVKELEPRSKRLTEIEKKLQEREETLRIRDYQSTPEYHTRYVKPIADAQAEVKDLMAELLVTDDSGATRGATEQDFQEVLSQPNLTVAARVAKQKFGEEAYQTVMQHRTRINSLVRAARQANDNAAIESAEYYKTQEMSQATRRQVLHEHLLNETKRFMDAEPDVFKPDESDGDAITALSEGQKFADVLLNGAPGMTPEKMVSEAARGRARIVKSYRQDVTIKRQEQKIKDLETELAQYRRSEPEVKTTTTNHNAPIQPTGREGRVQRAMAMAHSKG